MYAAGEQGLSQFEKTSRTNEYDVKTERNEELDVKTERNEELEACIQISVDYFDTYRMMTGPVEHTVTLQYVRPPENVERELDKTDAMKKALIELQNNYKTYASFQAVSPAFRISTNVDHIPPLIIDATTPHKEKSKPERAQEFCQDLINRLTHEPVKTDYDDFKHAQSSHNPPKPPPLDFTGI